MSALTDIEIQMERKYRDSWKCLGTIYVINTFRITKLNDGESIQIWKNQNNTPWHSGNCVMSCYQSVHSLWRCLAKSVTENWNMNSRQPSADCTELLSFYCCCLSYYFHQHVLFWDSLHLHIFLFLQIHSQAVPTLEATCPCKPGS